MGPSANNDESIDFVLAGVCKLHHDRIRSLFEAVGLYRGQPPVLRILAEAEGLSHSELAMRMRVTPATISKMIDRMERAGFVMRQPDPHDQRVSRVYTTEQGRAVQAEIGRLILKIEQEAFAGFTLEERVLLRRFLLQVRDNLARATGAEPRA
jgi:MarR family transcriptional regulator, organic hydroperoxide resistance regulator